MDKQAYQAGVELALKEAGLFGPSDEELRSRSGKMLGGSLAGLALGSVGSAGAVGGMSKIPAVNKLMGKLMGKNPLTAGLLAGGIVGGGALGGSVLGQHATSGPEGREYWNEKFKEYMDNLD